MDNCCSEIVAEFKELARKEQYGENWLQLTSADAAPVRNRRSGAGKRDQIGFG
jgi:hypothetical protein